jgi:hypothetical protein
MGLIILALGIRLVERLAPTPRDTSNLEVGNVQGLFGLVIVLYGAGYVFFLYTRSFAGYDLVMDRILLTRQIPLLLLWFEVLRQRRHKIYLWLSLGFVVVSSFGSYFSDFKTPLLFALIVSASTWKPWESQWWRFSVAGTARFTALAGVALFLVLTWQAGVKKDTRRAYEQNGGGSSPGERIELFLTSAEQAVPTVFSDTRQVVEDLVSRVWYVVFFSRVLDHVPAVEPHANGELLQMAISNAVMPRLFFPDKPPLPSDSYYTRRFAAVQVAEGATTSISIGYMAEFYADWGYLGMFVSIFAFGALMGLVSWIVRAFAPAILVDPALMTLMLPLANFEQQFIKTLAGLIMSVGVTVIVVRAIRGPLTSFLRMHPVARPVEPLPGRKPLVPGPLYT